MKHDLSKLNDIELLKVFQQLLSKPTPLTEQEQEDFDAVLEEMDKRNDQGSL